MMESARGEDARPVRGAPPHPVSAGSVSFHPWPLHSRMPPVARPLTDAQGVDAGEAYFVCAMVVRAALAAPGTRVG
jgi:hypothetical protein